MTERMKALNIIFVMMGAVIITGCQSGLPKYGLSRTSVANTGAPKISRLVDLGNPVLSEGVQLSGKKTDARFSPGEFVLVQGKDLGNANIVIDDINVPIDWYCGGSAVIKVPSGLSPVKKHRLSVTTPMGTATAHFESSHYILTSDTDGNKLYYIRTDPNERGSIEPEWIEQKQTRPLFNAISKDGAYGFSINLAEADDAKEKGLKGTHFLEVNTIELNAPGTPKIIARKTIPMDSSPSDAYMNSDGILALLGKTSVVFVDTSDPISVKEVQRFSMPADTESFTLTAIAFIKENTVAVLLEANSNTLYFLSVADGSQPALISKHRLLADKTIPLVVHLTTDPKDSSKVWVLISPNLRMVGSKISETYKKLFKDKELDPGKKGAYALMSLTVDDDLKVAEGQSIELPPGFAYHFVAFHQDGRAYITGSRLDIMDFRSWKEERSNAVERAAKFLRDTLYFGRVVAVDTETGNVEKVSHGAGIYMNLICIPDIGPVFSLMKFGPSLSFPFLTPKWGMGIKSTGTYAKRKMNIWTIFPPYSPGCVSYQE